MSQQIQVGLFPEQTSILHTPHQEKRFVKGKSLVLTIMQYGVYNVKSLVLTIM